MSSPVSTRPAPIRVPVWAWAATAVAVVIVYLLLQDSGIVFTHGVADYLHEFTHDGRHALGAPCD